MYLPRALRMQLFQLAYIPSSGACSMDTRRSFLAIASKKAHAPSSEKLSLTTNSQSWYVCWKIVSILSGRYARVFRLGKQTETNGRFIGCERPNCHAAPGLLVHCYIDY